MLPRALDGLMRQLERRRRHCHIFPGSWTLGSRPRLLSTAVTLLGLFLCVSLWVGEDKRMSSSTNWLNNFRGESQFQEKEGERVKGFNSIGILSVLFPSDKSTKDSVKSEAQRRMAKIAEENGALKRNPEILNRVKAVFKEADKNRDSLLSPEEISNHINFGVRRHFSTAILSNFDNYRKIDTSPRDGLVTWKEFLAHLLKKKGLSGDAITLEDYNKKTIKYKSLPKDIKVEIVRNEIAWSEVANSSPEYLNVDEFFAFSHPEASPTRILSLVSDIFNTFDSDGDGKISQKEFDYAFYELGSVDHVLKEDFKIIDKDKTGIISRVEMMKYIDPREMHNSEKEAEKLVKSIDKDLDGKLSLKEIQDMLSPIVKSKFYDADAALHSTDPE